jgi:topB: DNA topoisomerase III
LKLVIAEKPSVAMSLAAVLGATERKDGYLEGSGYLVSWCVGHLLELAQPEAYKEQYAKWRYEDLPILPENWKYEVPKDKKTQLALLCRLMKDKRVDSVVCATDAGREGELIFRLVYEYAGCKSLWSAFGFPVWRMRRSVRALTISTPAVITISSMMRRSAGQEPTG